MAGPRNSATRRSDAVRAFAEEQRELVTFHTWLQWLADRQLGEAQARALEAGLRIGLYLDLAVGVAPDGSATWSDRGLVVPTARIGAPPDYFNADGQDWGLAPLSPAGLVARNFEPYRESIDAVVRHAGALRIDHAMSLYRLFWIAENFGAADGVYVRYPFHEMLKTLAAVSQARQTIDHRRGSRRRAVGLSRGDAEKRDPELSRLLLREGRATISTFRPNTIRAKRSPASASTTSTRSPAGGAATTSTSATRSGCWRTVELRAREGHPRAPAPARARRCSPEKGCCRPDMGRSCAAKRRRRKTLPESLAVAFHRLLARTPSRLFVVQAEDLTGALDQVNIPGTVAEHPNWRRKLAVDLEALPDDAALSRPSPRRCGKSGRSR